MVSLVVYTLECGVGFVSWVNFGGRLAAIRCSLRSPSRPCRHFGRPLVRPAGHTCEDQRLDSQAAKLSVKDCFARRAFSIMLGDACSLKGAKAASKYYPAESSGRTGAAGGVGGPSAATGGAEGAGAAGAAERELSPKLTASALQALRPAIPSPALAAFEAREVPEGLPTAARQSGTYWGGKVGFLPGCSLLVR